MKNIRNNWHTEKTQTLRFQFCEEELYACWSDLKEIHKHEDNLQLKISKLTKAAVYPTNIEKQKVSLALHVFHEKTSAALRSSSISNQHPSMASTAQFINSVIQLWKLLNCKSIHESRRNNDPDKRVIDKTDEGQRGLSLLRNWAQRADQMKQDVGPRVKSLTNDTAGAIKWTCLCLADISEYLLSTNTSSQHDFVPLGFFQQDDLEHHFAHFRMAAGCNFYITVQEVFATHSLDRAQMMLKVCEEFDHKRESHQCDLCEKPLTDDEILLMDDMVRDVDTAINSDEKLSLFYIAGYIASKHEELCGNANEEAFEEVKEYLSLLDKGKLTYPTVEFYDLILLAYAFFSKTPEKRCRKRFVSIKAKFPEIFHLEIHLASTEPLMRLSNVFLKQFARFNNKETSSKSSKAAIVKLSSGSAMRQ